MNVLSNYITNYNQSRYNNVYRLNGKPFRNIIAFKAAPEPFEDMFKKEFLDLLVKEGATCAYTGIRLFPFMDLWAIASLKNLIIPINYDLNFLFLRKCNEKIFKGKNKTYNIIAREHKKNPKYKLNEIIDKLYPNAVKSMRKKQAYVLMNAAVFPEIERNLPVKESTKIRNFIMNSYYANCINSENANTIEPHVIMQKIKKLNISDNKVFAKLYKKLSKLPTFFNSPEGFILYCKTNELKPKDIAIQMLKNVSATRDHIHPQAMQKKEALESVKEENDPPFWVTILCSEPINKYKGCMDFNDFLKYCPFPVRKNLQKHIDSLIEIYLKWENQGKLARANKLIDYILVLKYELERRANRLNINVDKLTDSIGQKRFDKKVNKVKDWLDIEK